MELPNLYKSLYILASEFEDKFEGRVCANGIDIYPTEPYSTLSQAKVACSNDQNCGKVVNFGCDGRRFHLCKKGSQIKFSDHGSCIYNHNREKGKYYIYFNRFKIYYGAGFLFYQISFS